MENLIDERPNGDNWWWMVVRTPAQEIHLFEIGESHTIDVLDDEGKPTGQQADEPISRDELAARLASLGGPEPEALTGQPGSWLVEMAPGRPNHLLEPKAHDHEGKLLPIRPKPGVTLHLLPADEPEAD